MDKLISKIIMRHLTETKADVANALNASNETMATTVWEQGYAPLREIFADRIILPKGVTTYEVPVPAIGTALEAEPVADNVTFIGMTYKQVVASKVRGVNYGWTRGYLESCAWDALAPQLKGAGEAVERAVFKSAYDHLVADSGTNDSTTWANNTTFCYAYFLAGVKALATHNYTCDVCILHPTEYFALLNDSKFIDASVIGSADPIKTGVIQTTLGVTVFMSTVATEGTAVFIDSKKALCMAVIRDKQSEEYSYPDSNLYGIVVTMKFGEEVILPYAICVMTEAAA